GGRHGGGEGNAGQRGWGTGKEAGFRAPFCYNSAVITSKNIRDYRTAQPFEPFDIRLSNGRAYTVDHPEFLALSRRGNVVSFYTDDDRLITIAVSQINTLEKLNRPAA